MTTRPVLVTGAGGNVGGAAVTALLAAGIPVRAAGRHEQVLRERFPGAETVQLDFDRPDIFDTAVAGTGGLFLLRPPAVSRVGPTLNALIDVAARHGVGPVVFSSVTGADTNRLLPHHRVEMHLRGARVPWTILRPGFFAQNLADAYRTDIREENRIYLPAGSGRVAFIDTQDIGAAAAAIFAAPAGHDRRSYVLTGAEALDFRAVAGLLTAVAGRPIRYEPASIAGYLRHQRRRGTPLVPTLVQTVLHTGLRRGQAQLVDPALPRLLGREPRTLEQYIRDHRDLWTAQPPLR